MMQQKDLFTKYKEFIIAIGLILWISILGINDGTNNTWGDYITAILILLLAESPVLIFYLLKHKLTPSFTKPYLKYWGLAFLILLPVTTDLFIMIAPGSFSTSFFVGSASAMLALEVLFSANSYYQDKVQHIRWIKKIGLENAVLVSIILLSLTISVMAVSSLNNPALHTKDQLLIGFEFKPSAILKHVLFFLSIFVQLLFMYLCGYVFFYINSKLLVGKILRKYGFILYLLSTLTIVALLYPVFAQLLILLPINKTLGREIFSSSPFDMENAAGAMAIMLISLPVILALQWSRQNAQIVALEREKSQTELDLLKQQLNPHFFFNTLNNLYALSLQKSDQAPDSILQLSDLMRYVIYKGQEQLAPLSQEIKYIEDYIQLQQMRLKKPLDFNFIRQHWNTDPQIAPLLLIVLVENAFKHGIEPAEDTATLKLLVRNDENSLFFSCENSFEALDNDAVPGIGLSNLRRRLELLYPGKQHILNITKTANTFKAELNLITG